MSRYYTSIDKIFDLALKETLTVTEVRAKVRRLCKNALMSLERTTVEMLRDCTGQRGSTWWNNMLLIEDVVDEFTV